MDQRTRPGPCQPTACTGSRGADRRRPRLPWVSWRTTLASHSWRPPDSMASHPIAQVMPSAPSPGLVMRSTPRSTQRAPPSPMDHAPGTCLRARDGVGDLGTAHDQRPGRDHCEQRQRGDGRPQEGHHPGGDPGDAPEGDPAPIQKEPVGDRRRERGDAVDEHVGPPQHDEGPQGDVRPHEGGEAEEHGRDTGDGEPLPATDVGAHHDVAPTVGAGSAARSSAAMRASRASMMAYSATFRK